MLNENMDEKSSIYQGCHWEVGKGRATLSTRDDRAPKKRRVVN